MNSPNWKDDIDNVSTEQLRVIRFNSERNDRDLIDIIVTEREREQDRFNGMPLEQQRLYLQFLKLRKTHKKSKLKPIIRRLLYISNRPAISL